MLVTLSVFSDREFAEALLDERRRPPEAKVRRLASAAIADFPGALSYLAMCGRRRQATAR